MIETFPDRDTLADAACAATVRALQAAIAARGRASLIGTGGRSPAPVYDRLARAELDWPRVTLSLSDDRLVPADDPASNEGLIRRRLLVGPAAAARFEPLRCDASDPQACADLAEPRLAALAPYDMLFLGMGEDGHVASLFPEHPGLQETRPTFPVRDSPKPPPVRISMSFDTINAADEVVLIAAGAAKADAVGLLINDAGPSALPAAGVHGRSLTVLAVDESAAMHLPPGVTRRS